MEHVRGSAANEGFNERWNRATGDRKQERTQDKKIRQGSFCARCGAWKGQLGLEPDPFLFVEHVVEVFREVRRVLAPHGSVWLNLGDSYNARPKGNLNGQDKSTLRTTETQEVASPAGLKPLVQGLKVKDLVMVPAMVALALRADGWWLRGEVVWSKTNPMPESVTDRPSKSHEMIYLLSKRESYYYDQEAVRETAEGSSTGRNLRTVWEIPAQPFSAKWLGFEDDDHYAAFPEDVVEPCLKATCPRWVCVRCGSPRRRIVERRSLSRTDLPPDHPEYRPSRYDEGKIGDEEGPGLGQRYTETRTLGWTECPCASGLPADSFEQIDTPLGEGVEDDPSLEVGRAGMSRPRNDGEGVRPMTRYEQRAYAEQLRALRATGSPRCEAMVEQVGIEAWAHYQRTDAAGARPIPPDVLYDWLARGWLARVELPVVPPGEYRPGRVLDPFCGSGTTAVVARRLHRECWGVEMSAKYVEIAVARVGRWWKRPSAPRRRETPQMSVFDLAAGEHPRDY